MEDLIFALDIGTRTVVGLVLLQEGENLHLLASKVLEHEQRAMLDGQIHQVDEVARLLKRVKEDLERELEEPLKEVAIAAAGRALKTVRERASIELERTREITPEDVLKLEYQAIQSAQQQLVEEEKKGHYHFVGYSVVQNRLDDILIRDLEGQRGQRMEVELIATFLPRIVVDSLLNAVHRAGLTINYMTLEPIAAANLVIPKELHSLNLALIDIGAGTSDIAITEKGTIRGYAMVPVAGDEITEAICDEYLLDFPTGEMVKKSLENEEVISCRNMLDQDLNIKKEEILRRIEPVVDTLTDLISQEIQRVNEKVPQAVMCVGGGSLTPLLHEKLAQALGLKPNRVAIKSREEIQGIEGRIEGISMAQAITPLGIARINRDEKKRAHFVDVTVNDEHIHLFTLTHPTLSDALLAADIDLRRIRGRPGLAVTVEVFGELRSCRGTLGNPGTVLVNDEEESLEAQIHADDIITVRFGADGAPGEGVIGDILPELKTLTVLLNEEETTLPPLIYMDGERVTPATPIKDRASIKYYNYEQVDHILKWLWGKEEGELTPAVIPFTLNGKKRQKRKDRFTIVVNDEEVSPNHPIQNGDQIQIRQLTPSFKIGEIIKEIEEDMPFHISLNGKKWAIPPRSYRITVNDQLGTMETPLQAGDHISYEPLPLKFNEVLEYTSYPIPQRVGGRLFLLQNGTAVGFTSKIASGDVLEIRFGESELGPPEG